jgi:Uma2 family endonuclease
MQLTTFEEKRRKFLPKVPRALGTPTIYLEGYPTEDGEPMAATKSHGRQITALSYQLEHYFRDIEPAYVGIDSFVYYVEDDRTKSIAPDVYVALGVSPRPDRRSFYTWREGAVPTVVFEFLSDSTANEDRGTKLERYFSEIGIREYFIHQPATDRPFEFRAWQRQGEGHEEIPHDERGGLYSEALNLWFSVEEDLDAEFRLMRPYLPDGTPIPTYEELKAEREAAKVKTEIAETRAEAAEVRLAEARIEIEEMRTEVYASRAVLAEARVQATQAETTANQAEARANQAETDAAEAKSLAASQSRVIEELQEEMARIRQMLEPPGRS